MSNRLYVGNLDFSVTDAELQSFFDQIGEVTYAKVVTDRRSGRSKGYGFVEMKTSELAEQAKSQYHGQMFSGRELRINDAHPPKPRENRRPPRRFDNGYQGGDDNRGNRRSYKDNRFRD